MEETQGDEAKLQHFLQWSQLNGVELRGCNIKYCDSIKGFGLFSSNEASDDVLLVVPLDLAITPMSVLQHPIVGPECRAMFKEGEVDDRLLMILFLTVERLRKDSLWNPYLDMLPTTFGTPLWFSDDELLELRGTALYKATHLQKKQLQSLYNEKVKYLVEKILNLYGSPAREVSFEDFLWANSIFWTRALNIPFPRSYVFPQSEDGQDSKCPEFSNSSGLNDQEHTGEVTGASSASVQGNIVWVEGLVPGIDFCNHDRKAAATWEVDETGSATGVPCSMYLLSASGRTCEAEKEISISYGNKGNEELLYLYGFVMDRNPDDYLMVHYPVEALQEIQFSDSKAQLLEAQKAELRCLLPRRLLDRGFFPEFLTEEGTNDDPTIDQVCSYSWSGQRKMPSYSNKLIFPQDFLTALRTIAMQENELFQVSSMLQELVGSEGDRQPSDAEVRAAVWEACGDSGALQMLVDLLNMKMMDLEEGSGKETCDSKLLENAYVTANMEDRKSTETDTVNGEKVMSRKRWSAIVYRKGQKQLTRLFLKEAEHALQLSLSEGSNQTSL